MNIILVTKKSALLKDYLDKYLFGNNITAFDTVHDLYKYVSKSAIRTKILIIDDNAINSEDTEQGFEILHKLLFEQKYFNYSKVIFLNLTSNQNNLSRYDFLRDDIETKNVIVEIYSQDRYSPSFIASLCKSTINSYNKKEVGDIAVVQSKRSAMLIKHENFKDENIHPNTSITHRYQNPDVKIIESRFATDNTKVGNEQYEEIELINDLPINVPHIEHTINLPKTILVTGSKNTGLSSTVLSLGYTSAKNNYKTLIIDLDTTSMGLSFLVDHAQKTNHLDIKPESFILYDLQGKGSIDELRMFTSNASNLHCLSITLQMIKNYPDITFIVSSILTQISGHYDRIFIDIPIGLFDTYQPLIERFVDCFLITFIPFINKSINTLRDIQNSNIVNSRQYRNNKVVFFNCGVPNNNKINLMKQGTFKTYIQNLLNKDFLVTNIFNLKDGYYCDMLPSILERMGEGVS